QEARAHALPRLAAQLGASELVYVATCNRVEVAFVAAPAIPLSAYRPRLWRALRGAEPEPGAAERALRIWGGEGAIEHLFLVASGLDSARIGETEIAAQVRAAHDLSRELGLAGPRLSRVFDEALRVARRVHALTAVSNGHVSLAEIAVERVRAAAHGSRAPIALLGVSPMTERAGRALAASGARLCVVNRTLANAQRLAAELGAAALALDEFRRDPPPLCALLAAASAPEPLLDREVLERVAQAGRPLLVDMGVPPNVDARAARELGLERVGMDELAAVAAHNRDARLGELGDARAIVDAALDAIARRMSARRLGPMQAALHERFRLAAAAKTEQLLRAELSGLDDARRRALREFGDALARQLAHLPSSGLCALADRHGMDAVESFFASADPDLRAALERALADESLPRAANPEDDA
ncbi:MAG: hypothetical protein EPO68_02535, partial [Planctomycetota bacterium]